MSERRKLGLPAGKPATDDDAPRRKPVRPNAPVARNRVRQEPTAPSQSPSAREPAAPQRQAQPPRPERASEERRPAAPRRDAPVRRDDTRQGAPFGTPAAKRTDRGPGHSQDRGAAPRRDERDGRDGRDGRDMRDARDPRDPRQGRQDERRDDRGRPAPPTQAQRAAPSRRSFEEREQHYATREPQRDAPPLATPRQAPDDGRVRLSKLMSEQGLSSRREADDWITQGWVSVDGEVVTELGTRILPTQTISIDPMASAQQAMRVTILLNKPIGYVSAQAEDGHEPAVVLIRPENRWAEDTLPWQLTRGHLHKLAPAGRLDIDSTGMLVLTQDGRIARHIIGEDALVEKEYLVRVVSMAQPEEENVMAVTPPEAIAAMQHGLWLDDQALKHAKVSWQNEQQLRVVLREGKKRQIRRMCELVGLKVTGLKRVRMGKIVLGKLPLGQWRFLRPDEQF
jgi:23S rRNA pseudouridine2604 synthase